MSRSRSVIDIGSGAASRRVSSDESDTEILPIDRIELESDEELDDVADTKKGKVPLRHADREKGLRPVRVERHEHVERVVSVNMESSTSKPAEAEAKYEDEVEESHPKKTGPEDDSLFVRDDDAIEPQVKEEPVDEDHTMTNAVPHDDGFLPAQKVKVRRRLSPKTPEPEPAPVPPSKPVAKDPRSLLRTKEDIEEYERHARDLEAILELLSVEPKESTAERLEPPAEGPTEPDTAVSDQEKEEKVEDAEEDETKDKLAGQLFLMQFPPMTPNLIVPGTGNCSTEDAATEVQAVPVGTRSGEAAVKLESGEVEILDGPDGTTSKAPSKILTAAGWQLSAGRVGKLNVHKSGRVTMDWGGISFELDRATPVDFLQEALIVSAPEASTPEEENRVWAMGQLSGKFTVTPDWEKML
jgi:DNA-directed RNA polymerase III subunit RPC4